MLLCMVQWWLGPCYGILCHPFVWDERVILNFSILPEITFHEGLQFERFIRTCMNKIFTCFALQLHFVWGCRWQGVYLGLEEHQTVQQVQGPWWCLHQCVVAPPWNLQDGHCRLGWRYQILGLGALWMQAKDVIRMDTYCTCFQSFHSWIVLQFPQQGQGSQQSADFHVNVSMVHCYSTYLCSLTWRWCKMSSC